MGSPSYASEPQIQYLHQILEQVGKVELLVPDFQRPPRWTDEQRRRLLQSVSLGYPIGSLMVWRTSVSIPYRTKIGFHELPLHGERSGQLQYLLDGFQRISTLYAALHGGSPSAIGPDDDGNRWALGYHLLEQEWIFLDEVEEDERAVVLPGHVLLSSVSLIRAQRSMMERNDVDTLLDRSDALVRSLREYKLPIIPLVTDEVDEATRTFGLLNTEGTRMSDLDLVVALTWSRDYDLRARLDEAKASLARIGWENLEEKYIMAALRSTFDLPLYDKDGNAKEIGERLRSEPDALASTIDGLVDAGSFLRRHCGVVSLDLLPYSYQGVILGDVLRRVSEGERTEEFTKNLMRWFWWTTAWGTFAGISGYRMNAMIAYLRDLGGGREVEWPWAMTNSAPAPWPATFDPRGARTRALALYLFQVQGRAESLEHRLEVQAGRALVRGLGRLPSATSRDPGNAFLLSHDEETEFLDALEGHRQGVRLDHPIFRDQQLRFAHLISETAWDALGRGDSPSFVMHRRETLHVYERHFLKNEQGAPPGLR